MTTTFRIASHLHGDGDLIEVFEDGVFVAAIYPVDGGIRIVSKHLDRPVFGALPNQVFDPAEPPALLVRFPR